MKSTYKYSLEPPNYSSVQQTKTDQTSTITLFLLTPKYTLYNPSQVLTLSAWF